MEEKQMAENGHLVAYLLVEKGADTNKKTYWRPLGAAYPCRDGSLNLKLDIHPGLTFNLRPPKSNGEREETEEPGGNVFPCDACHIATSIDEAHLLGGGGAVCDKCFKSKYQDCQACDKAFPKVIGGAICPLCK